MATVPRSYLSGLEEVRLLSAALSSAAGRGRVRHDLGRARLPGGLRDEGGVGRKEAGSSIASTQRSIFKWSVEGRPVGKPQPTRRKCYCSGREGANMANSSQQDPCSMERQP